MIYRIACISRRTGNHLGYVMCRNGTNFHKVREFSSYASALAEAQRLNRTPEKWRKCEFVPEVETDAKARRRRA